MSISDMFKSAIKALKINKGRTVLTMLGIVIGITAIILIMSLGQGAQNLILGQIQSFGSKTIVIAPGRQPKGPADVISIFTDSLKEKDLQALQKKINVPHAEKVMPVVFGSQAASYKDETYRPTIFGVTEFFAQIYDLYPEEGRLFSDEEVKNNAEVVLIGSKVKEELFGNTEALGQKIRIQNRNFKVIGVFPQKGQFSFISFDEAAVMPYTVAQQYIFGIKYYHRFVVEADSEKHVAQTVADIKRVLRASHNINSPEDDDFFVETQTEAMESIKTITDILTYFLAAVAAISLLVGGIGIMNIMLVSVTERTKEIGLRKAVGAKNKDILIQFLIEAMIFTVFGGAIGIGLGIIWSLLGALVISYFLGQNWPPGISIFSILLGFAVAGLIGVIFGLYPARRASRLDPIKALRYE